MRKVFLEKNSMEGFIKEIECFSIVLNVMI